MNGSMKYTIRRDAERLQQILLDYYGENYTPPEALEANKLAFLLTHSPKAFLGAFGSETIDSQAVRDCLAILNISMPHEVYDIIRHHNAQVEDYERRASLLPVKRYQQSYTTQKSSTL